MALLTLRMLLSLITLNSLLQIYENQLTIDTSFNSSQQPDQSQLLAFCSNVFNNSFYFDFLLIACDFLSQYPNFTCFWQANKIFHVLAQISLIIVILTNKGCFRSIDVVFGLSVIIQNSNYYFPKSLNLIQICCSMLNVFQQIFYLACKIQDKINESNITLSQQQQFNKEVQTKSQVHPISKQGRRSKMSKKQNQNTDQLKQDKQLCEDQNKIINKEENQFSPEIIAIEEKQEVHRNEKGEPPKDIDSKQKVANIEPEKQTVEQETENENEPIHANLSEITSVKDEQKIQLQITLKGLTKCEDCNLDHFEKTTTGILEKNYTEHQIIQIQIHLLLNLYEANEDKNFKLWCLKKVLQLVY